MENVYIIEECITDNIWCRINNRAYKNEKEAMETIDKCYKLRKSIYRVRKLVIS